MVFFDSMFPCVRGTSLCGLVLFDVSKRLFCLRHVVGLATPTLIEIVGTVGPKEIQH